jgi:putative membrane protein
LSDGQILAVVSCINSAEINQGELARTRANGVSDREFAKKMVDDHSESRQQGTRVAAQASLATEPSALSKELESKASQVLRSLETAKLTAFDSTYMQAQVKQHREALNLLDSRLIPTAESAALSGYLSDVRSTVQMHLDRAEQIAPTLTPPAAE